MVEAAIGISLVINYFMKEYLGIISGGFVAPAYLALFMHRPGRIAGTFLVGFLTFATMKLLRNVIFIYGRRNLMLCLIIGFAYNYLFMKFIAGVGPSTDIVTYEVGVIGNIIPGIIAYWMEEQGVTRTLTVMLTNAILTALFVMLFFGRIFAL